MIHNHPASTNGDPIRTSKNMEHERKVMGFPIQKVVPWLISPLKKTTHHLDFGVSHLRKAPG